jgi:monovalent cation/hydrogen antiporter
MRLERTQQTMDNLIICLTLILLLVVAGIISRLTTSLPIPIVQILLGAIVSLFFPTIQAGFNPEVFMLLFIPPLLFSDSWRFPKREFENSNGCLFWGDTRRD